MRVLVISHTYITPANRGKLRALAVAVIPQLGVHVPTTPEHGYHDGLAIGFVGRLVPEKGLDTLLQALGEMRALRWRLIVVGDGPDRERLERLATELRLAARVRWLGALPAEEVPKVWPDLDVLVLPSRALPTWAEPAAPVVAEAMGRAVAVVGTSAGATPELIGDDAVSERTVAFWKELLAWNDQSPARARSPPRALARDGPLRPSAVRLARERRPGVRGAARGVDRRHHARTRQRPAALGGVSPLVGAGCGPDQVRPTGPPARAAALFRALFPLSVVAQARCQARAAGAHPRSHLRPHGDAGAPPARGGDGARSHAGDHPALPHRRLARGAAQPLSAAHPQGVAAGAGVHRGHRVAEARARDLAGRRPPHHRGAVRSGPRVLLRGARRARPRARRLAHPRGRLRGAARGEHRRAEERPPGDQYRGAAAHRGGRIPVAGGRTLHGRPGPADRAAGNPALRAERAVRRRDHAAARLSRRGRAAVPVAVRRLRVPRARSVRVGTAGRDLGRRRSQGSGRRRDRGGRGPRSGRVRPGAREPVGRRDAARGAGGAWPGAGPNVHLAAHGGADGGGLSSPALGCSNPATLSQRFPCWPPRASGGLSGEEVAAPHT